MSPLLPVVSSSPLAFGKAGKGWPHDGTAIGRLTAAVDETGTKTAAMAVGAGAAAPLNLVTSAPNPLHVKNA